MTEDTSFDLRREDETVENTNAVETIFLAKLKKNLKVDK